MKTKTIKGYKGFNKDLKCRDFQYEVGKEYSTDVKPIRCTSNGFHLCKEPLDVFSYYSPADSVFHHVEGSGEVDESTDDSKVAVQKIKIGTEISLADFIKLSFEAIFKRCKKEKNLEHSTGDRSASSATGHSSASSATGYRSASSATGHSSASSATGYMSASSATGDSSASSATGHRSASLTTGSYSSSQINNSKAIISKNAVAIGTGYQNKAKAPLDCWIVLSEWDEQSTQIINLKTAKVDGKKILPDTWYMLKNGKFVKE